MPVMLDVRESMGQITIWAQNLTSCPQNYRIRRKNIHHKQILGRSLTVCIV